MGYLPRARRPAQDIEDADGSVIIVLVERGGELLIRCCQHGLISGVLVQFYVAEVKECLPQAKEAKGATILRDMRQKSNSLYFDSY